MSGRMLIDSHNQPLGRNSNELRLAAADGKQTKSMSQGNVSYMRHHRQNDGATAVGAASSNFKIKGNVNHLKANDSSLPLNM